MLGENEGTRQRGRPATIWLDILTTAVGVTLEDLARLAPNQLLCRSLIYQVARTQT